MSRSDSRLMGSGENTLLTSSDILYLNKCRCWLIANKKHTVAFFIINSSLC